LLHAADTGWTGGWDASKGKHICRGGKGAQLIFGFLLGEAKRVIMYRQNKYQLKRQNK
jgi:hypothetical protein